MSSQHRRQKRHRKAKPGQENQKWHLFVKVELIEEEDMHFRIIDIIDSVKNSKAADSADNKAEQIRWLDSAQK